jgi:uncharacterized protein involved in type VI secretion and phage assembly
VEPAPGPGYEHYDHPGGLSAPEEASREAKLRTQADRAENTIIEVQGKSVGLGVGDLVSLRSGLEPGDESVPFWSPDGFDKQYLRPSR